MRDEVVVEITVYMPIYAKKFLESSAKKNLRNLNDEIIFRLFSQEYKFSELELMKIKELVDNYLNNKMNEGYRTYRSKKQKEA